MIVLAVSDLHLGRGKYLSNGQLNIVEDFGEDELFYEFLDHYCTGKFYWASIHLVLNGDILNLIQIDHAGVFSHIIDEEHTKKSLQCIHDGHKKFFAAIKNFMHTPNKKCTYIIGNHDNGMAFVGAQNLFRSLTNEKIDFAHMLEIDGIHIEHGHRFEVVNTVPQKKYFTTGPMGQKILNLPWGSLFCIFILPRLKKERPLIDKVRPMGSYIKWCAFHDFFFFIRMLKMVLHYFIRSQFITGNKNNNFKTTLGLLRQITIYPKYAKKAKKILQRRPHLKVVIMGHTHLQEWRRFPEGKYYLNTGTWNQIPSVDAALHENITKFSYCTVEVHNKTGTILNASLNVWKGKWKPYLAEAQFSSKMN